MTIILAPDSADTSILFVSRLSNIATIETQSDHNLLDGYEVMIRNVGDESFNITGNVESVISSNIFTLMCKGHNKNRTPESGSILGGYASEYFNYPHKTKVLSGVLYGHKNSLKGELNPKNYVNSADLKSTLVDKTDMKEG
jgi:hypothetical protein